MLSRARGLCLTIAVLVVLTLLPTAVPTGSAAQVDPACVVTNSGNFADEINAISDQMPGSGSDGMVRPTIAQIATWETMIQAIANDDLAAACSVIQANGFPYHIVRYIDTGNGGETYLILKEDLPISKGWGTYVFRSDGPFRDVVVEIPHPRIDWQTDEQGAEVFRQIKARALLLSGTNRCANQTYSPCTGTTTVCGSSEPHRESDVAHATQTMFHASHRPLVGCGGKTAAIQLHGHSQADCPDLFISNTTRSPAELANLLYENVVTYCSAFSVDVADGVQPECPLIGGTNVQGRYSNGCSTSPEYDPCNTYPPGPSDPEQFLHLEQSRDLRQNYACLIEALNSTFPLHQPSSSVGCTAGSTYDPACDVDADGDTDIADIQLVASHWGHRGTWSCKCSGAGNDAHNHLGETWTGNDNPLVMNGSFAGSAPLRLSNSHTSGDGLRIDFAADDGVQVRDAGNDGVLVENAADEGVQVIEARDVGVLVQKAGTDGVGITRAGNPSTIEGSSENNGLEVAGAEGNGVFIGHAGSTGMQIRQAGSVGVYVGQAALDGVKVYQAGNVNHWINNTGKNGFEVAGAEHHGLFVGQAGGYGVYVSHADGDGVYVYEAEGYAGYFRGNVRITGTCTGCVLADLGHNVGETALEPGDIAAVRGVTPTDLDGTPVVMDVRLATGLDAVIGVVAGRVELDKYEDNGQTLQRFVPREGPAQPGEYVSIVIYGLAQVKVSAADNPIQPGTRLTAADSPGHAQAVQTVEVQGVRVAESAPIIGVALESLEAGEGLIWVLVNPR